MVKIYSLAFIYIFFGSIVSLAQEDKVPDIDSWVESYKKESKKEHINRLMIIKGWRGKSQPVLASYKSHELKIDGLLSTATNAEIKFTYSLNRSKRSEIAKKPISERLGFAAKLTRSSDLILTNKKQWKYFQSRENGSPKLVFAAKSPTNNRASTIRSWISSNLGYQGVVLAQKGDFFLVGNITGKFASKDLQALVLADSHDKFRLKNKGNSGVGLLKLEDFNNSYGIFRTIFLEDESAKIPPGSKLILEKAK